VITLLLTLTSGSILACYLLTRRSSPSALCLLPTPTDVRGKGFRQRKCTTCWSVRIWSLSLRWITAMRTRIDALLRWNFLERNFCRAVFVFRNRSKYSHEHDDRSHSLFIRI